MKLRIFLITLVFASFGCNNSGSSNSAPATADSVITVMPNPITASPGASAMITPTGGTPPYTFVLTSSIGGYLTQATGTYTMFTAGTISGTAILQVTDSASQTVDFPITVGGVGTVGGTLFVSPNPATVAVGGNIPFSVSGGTPPYYYQVLSGGGSFSGNVFYAPTVASTVTVQVYDSVSNSTQVIITVGSGVGISASGCEGTFNMDLAGTSATLTIVEDANGNIGGDIAVGSAYAPIQGTCSSNGTTNTISFTNLYSGSPYSGTYFSNANNTSQIFMSGTFNDNGTTYSWFASD